MFPASELPTGQAQKIGLFFLLVLTLLGISTAMVFRFVPAFNDILSGRPAYMRSIVTTVAEQAASREPDAPIFSLENDGFDCRGLKTANDVNPGLLYFVFVYSVDSHSFCLVVYALAQNQPHSRPELVTTLNPNQVQSHGPHRLTSPVAVVPVGHAFAQFSAQEQAWLDWRQPSPGHPLGLVDLHQARSDPYAFSLQVELQDIDDLRARVARRHNRVNALLSWSIAGFFLELLIVANGIAICFSRFRTYCQIYGYRVNFAEYSRKHLLDIVKQAQSTYHRRQEELQIQSRAENLARRHRQEIRDGLQALLQIITDPLRRSEIDECLSRGSLEQMEDLLRELEHQSQQKTPEERLSLLVESLKEYCSDAEFQSHRQQAYTVLENQGFRTARELVIQTYQELKIRARKSQVEDELAEQE